MQDIYSYLTSYCNKPHRMADGKPIKHECYIIPPRALKAEREGDVATAIHIIQHSDRKHHMGTRK